jgi:hypothetical protein
MTTRTNAKTTPTSNEIGLNQVIAIYDVRPLSFSFYPLDSFSPCGGDAYGVSMTTKTNAMTIPTSNEIGLNRMIAIYDETTIVHPLPSFFCHHSCFYCV